MAQTITLKSDLQGIVVGADYGRFKFSDITLVAGANAVQALPFSGPSFVLAVFKMKTIVGGTALTFSFRFADNTALTTNPMSSTNWDNTDFSTPVHTCVQPCWTDLSTSAHFGIFVSGTLTGTYTLDVVYEIYPIA